MLNEPEKQTKWMPKKIIFSGLAVTASFLLAHSATAQVFFDDTYLIDVNAGEGLSDSIRQFRFGGYELSDGRYMSFSDWYDSNWRDLHVTMMTRISDNFGFVWGFGTGEIGEKYSIDPSIRLGFVWQAEPAENLRFSVMATGLIGGRLKEKTCTAKYGAIGGSQTVNCRLAATFMAPSETLNYLISESPYDQVQIRLSLVYSF